MPLSRGDIFERLTTCGVFSRSAEIFREEPVTFLIVGAIALVPGFFFNLIFMSDFDAFVSLADMSDPEKMEENLFGIACFAGTLLLLFLVSFVLSIILKVVVIRTTVQIYVGRKPSFRSDIQHGSKLLPRIFCFGLALICASVVALFGVVLVGGILLGIFSMLVANVLGDGAGAVVEVLFYICIMIAILYLSFSAIFWDTALVVEDIQSWHLPLFRSFSLVRKEWCFVFCTTFVKFLAVIAIYVVNKFLFGSLGPYAVTIAQTLLGSVVTPYGYIFLTVLYINCRVHQEGCNRDVIAREMKLDEGEISYETLKGKIAETSKDETEVTESCTQIV